VAVELGDQALVAPEAVDLVAPDARVQLRHRELVLAEEAEEPLLEGRSRDPGCIRDAAQCIAQPLRSPLPGALLNGFG